MADALETTGAEVTRISLRDYPAPIYDGDLEADEGQPDGVQRFRALLADHDGLLIGCPEYNGFMTPLLINTIDWATRSPEAQPDTSLFRGKSLLIVSSAPGSLAGVRASTHLRTMLTGIGCLLCPESFAVPAGFKAFADDGTLLDEKLTQRAATIAGSFHEFTQRTH